MVELKNLITRCVDCEKETLRPEQNIFRCTECNRVYAFDEHGVMDAFPKNSRRPLPAFYRSGFYQRWMAAWEQMVQKWIIYDKPTYRFFSMSGHREVVRKVHASVPADVPVLDLGCGHGQLFYLLDPKRCIGLDSSHEFLKVLKRRFPEATAIRGDFCNTPFASGGVRCAVSLHVLEHLYYLAESFEEMQRIVGKSGKLIFSIPTEGGWGWKLGRRLVTGPHLRKKYQLDVEKVMTIEHLNDANRILRLMRLYFGIKKLTYRPFKFLPFLGINSSITGIAEPDPEYLSA